MSNIKLFENKKIRSVWSEENENWYFVVADVVEVLTDTPNPSDYIKKMRKRDDALARGGNKLSPPFPLTDERKKRGMKEGNRFFMPSFAILLFAACKYRKVPESIRDSFS